MKNISGVVPGSIPQLVPVLKKWIYVNNKYVADCNGADAPWFYNERASVSTLSAAAWLADWHALEEYSGNKKAVHNEPGGPTSKHGRYDLFIGWVKKKPIKPIDFIIEAKMIWPILTGSACQRHVTEGLGGALADVRKTQSYAGAFRLGLVFVSPRVPKKHRHELPELIAQFVEDMKTIENAAMAWTFPLKGMRFWSDKSGYIYPGTAVILKRVREPNG